jgi:hypothetical protein
MKQQYQIDKQRAVQRFRRFATETNRTFKWCCRWPRSWACSRKAWDI